MSTLVKNALGEVKGNFVCASGEVYSVSAFNIIFFVGTESWKYTQITPPYATSQLIESSMSVKLRALHTALWSLLSLKLHSVRMCLVNLPLNNHINLLDEWRKRASTLEQWPAFTGTFCWTHTKEGDMFCFTPLTICKAVCRPGCDSTSLELYQLTLLLESYRIN